MMREVLSRGGTVCFTPQGISMKPMLRGGVDTITLSPSPPRLRKYDLPLVLRDDGTYVLHRVVRKSKNGLYTLCGDNQYALEKGVRHDQVVGVVTAFVRGGRAVSCGNFLYKLYCRLWSGTRLARRVFFRVLRWLYGKNN